MRDINECKAEVFRRSENRIKEIKKRRKKAILFVAMCLPLCLVLSFAPIFSSGNGMAEEDHSDGIADGYKDVDSVNKSEASSNDVDYKEGVSNKPANTDGDRKEKEDTPEGIVLLSLTVLKESEKGVELSEITKADVVTGIYNTVSEIIESFDWDDYTLYTGDNKELLNQTLGPADKYTLVFYYKSGESAEYTLEGQRLTKLPEGKTVLLTLSEARILRASFGFND